MRGGQHVLGALGVAQHVLRLLGAMRMKSTKTNLSAT